MIKIGLRHNLLYLLILMLSNVFRNIITEIMDLLLISDDNNDNSLLLTLIMFFGEFIFGLIFFKYHSNFLKKKNNDSESTFMGIQLIQNSSYLSRVDTNITIYLYIIAAASFDFLEFILLTYYIPIKSKPYSNTLNFRMRSILAIYASLFCYLLLGFRIYRHQKFSLIIIFICFLSVVISEYIITFFFNEGKNMINFSLYILLIIANHFFFSIYEGIEKYLLEFNSVNPFQMLMIEGAFGFFLTFFYSIINNIKHPFNKIKYNLESKKNIILLILFLMLYFLLSGSKNTYRLITNRLYSPTTTSLIYLMADPLFLLYSFFNAKSNDFKINNNPKNVYYFIINIILSFIIVFTSLIYNEFLIIFCCNLAHDTHYEINIRAKAETMEISLVDAQ